MKTDGIWSSEVYGPYGWENNGVLRFEDGKIFGGDGHQFTVGSYEMAGSQFTADLEIKFYGRPKTMFGVADEKFASKVAGSFEDGKITGKIARHDKPEIDLPLRLTRQQILH